MYGFHGRLLQIDLTSGHSSSSELEESRLRAFLGGLGLGTSLLSYSAPTGVEPFSPDNIWILTSAPLIGSGLTTTAKFGVATKSPLTGFIGDSLSSSHFALELKRTGFDGIVITGRAPSLVYIFINNQTVEIREAEHLRGKSPRETEAAIKAELNSPAIRVAAIGAAGENRVRFATISNEGRHAGRGGVGAVMGSKNLKAVALCGDRDARVFDPDGVNAIASSLRQRSLSSLTDKYRNIGTVANLAVFNRLGVLPAHNFQQSTFTDSDALSGETLSETSFARRHGCASCSIRCERLFKSLNGEEQRLEYETLFALGPLCSIKDPDTVLEAAHLCDLYGVDTISTGGTLDWAMHVKGLELPGYEPRGLKTMALGLAVSPRGACHNRSGAYEADFSGAVDRLRADPNRGTLVAASEDFAAVLDSMIICKFLRKCFTDFYSEGAELLSKVTGWDFSADELRRVGERIQVSKRLFNEREGWRTEDDWLPPRLLVDALPTGVGRGTSLTPAELNEMIQSYYQARGWDNRGFVSAENLRELSLSLIG